MLIGMAIDTSGLFPAKETANFAAFGKEIQKRFAHSIAETHGKGQELILKLADKPVPVNQIVLMEDITKGENIRKYVVEAWVDGQWKPLCDGSSVGHKRIQVFDAVSTEKLRLRIMQSTQEPLIRMFAAYHIDPGK